MGYSFYLIRHGKAVKEPTIVGSTDLPLTEEGIEQCRAASKLLEKYPVDAVFASPLKRAVQTACLLYPGSDPVIIDGLREYDFGSLENVKFADVMKEPDLEKLTRLTRVIPGAENKKEYAERIFGAFSKAVEGCMRAGIHKAAIVSHGYNIMTLMAAFSYPKLDTMFDWMVSNCCGYLLKSDPALWMRSRVMETAAEISRGELIAFER